MANQEPINPDDQDKERIKQINDKEVIRRILSGEKNLYALLIRKYNQRFFRIGLSIINNEPEVQDVMQTTYLKAYENLSRFRFQSSFSTWITKILVNECLLFLKRKKQKRTKENEKFLQDVDRQALELQTPLMKVLNTELKIILEVSIRSLPEKYRTVFIMRELENMSVPETMDCLSLSEANVKIRLNRARVMLREKLGEYLKDDEILSLYEPHCDRMVNTVMEKIFSERKSK